MSKTSQEQIKKDEQTILGHLKKNSKEHIDVLAKHTGFSRQKVWRLIKNLEEQHVIWGYTVVTDAEKQDTGHFTLLIKRSMAKLDKKIFDKVDSLQLEDIADPLGVSIESSCLVHGCYDWVISVSAENIQKVRRFCEVLSTGFPGAIEKIDVLQSLYYVRKHHIFNPDRKKLRDLL